MFGNGGDLYMIETRAQSLRLEGEPAYPRGLRVFTRFVLLPIVALYLLILLVYFAKVLVTWAWPSGWIGWLVSAVAVAGISSLVLVHPLATRPGDRWVGLLYADWPVFVSCAEAEAFCKWRGGRRNGRVPLQGAAGPLRLPPRC